MVDIDQNFFYKLLHQNYLVQDVDVEQINTLLKEYPAFHSLYTFKALILKNESEEDFEQVLPQIATNVLDRAQLYDILFNPLEKPISNQDAAKIENAASNTDLSVKESAEDNGKIENENASKSLNENSTKKSNLEAVPEEQKEDVSTKKEPENIDEEKVDIKEQEELSDVADTQINKTEKQENLSFVEWLKQKNKSAISIDSSKDDINKTNISSKSEKQKVPFEAVSEIEAELMKSSARQPQSHLDSFISSQIAKKKNKKKFPPQKVENERDSQGLISETLAEILFLQKKYDDAIDVYEKLSLKYPQKSSYFASRIKKIKKII